MGLITLFKSCPYWLKGGLIGTIFISISFLFTLIFKNQFNFLTFPFQFIWIFLNLFIGQIFGGTNLIYTGVEVLGFYELTTFGSITLIIFVFSIFFLIGALIGWIYGKIKSKS